MDNSTIFSDMYKVSHTTLGDLVPVELLETDPIFMKTIDGCKRWFRGDIPTVSTIYHIVKINDVEHVGYVIIEKVLDNQSYDDLVQKLGSEYIFLEKRIIGRDQRSVYYVTVLCHIIRETATDEEKMVKDVIMLDLESRNMDYIIDCIYNDQQTVSKLYNTKHVDDPLVTIAKLCLLFNSSYGRSTVNMIESIAEDETEQFHLTDTVFLHHMRTDWLLSKSILSSDKANTFANQILLKQELYSYCKAAIDATSLINVDVVLKSAKPAKSKSRKAKIIPFSQMYHNLFISGDVYGEQIPKVMSEFITIGPIPYSTENLQKDWDQLI